LTPQCRNAAAATKLAKKVAGEEYFQTISLLSVIQGIYFSFIYPCTWPLSLYYVALSPRDGALVPRELPLPVGDGFGVVCVGSGKIILHEPTADLVIDALLLQGLVCGTVCR